MKSKNRIHRNGASKTVNPQVKIPATSDAEQSVTIKITSESGEVIAEFDVPKPFHAAMSRDAKAKGISLQQWIENAVQAKVLKETTAIAPAGGDDEIMLMLFSNKKGMEIAHADLTREDMISITRNAAAGNSSLEEMLGLGLDWMKTDISKRRLAWEAAQELHEAAAQSNVMLELIECHLDHREHRTGEDFTGERADEFNFGLSFLAQQTRQRLKQAAVGIMGAAYGKKQGVAS